MTRPRFVKAHPQPRELSRWHLTVHRDGSDVILGTAISRRWGQASVYWLAEVDGALLMQPPPSEDPQVFLSRKQAANAVLLAWQEAQPKETP